MIQTLDRLKNHNGYSMRADGIVETYTAGGDTYFWTPTGDGMYRMFGIAPKIT